jgi:hypothetical protein
LTPAAQPVTEKPPETPRERPPEEATGREPVPDEVTLSEARERVRDVYRADFAQQKLEERRDLAAKLFRLGQRPKETTAFRFALLREARDLAAGLPDPALVVQVVDEIAKIYTVNVAALKAEGLATATKAARTAQAYKAVADTALAAADEAARIDDYAAAFQLTGIAADCAVSYASVPFQTTVRLRKDRYEVWQKEYDKVKDAAAALKGRPNDAAANTAVGHFECLVKGDWDRGLLLLARGSDAALAEVARKDLAKPQNAGKLLEVADGWWSVGEKESAPAKEAPLNRARALYRRALPSLAGPERSRAEDRLKLVVGRVQLKPGLVTEIFSDEEFNRRVKTRVDYAVNFNWGEGAPAEGVPADHFSLRWQGYLLAPQKGVYTLVIHADDGARLYLDNQLVIDSWGKMGRQTARWVLDEKPHPLRLEHHEGVGEAMMYFGWAREGGSPEQAVPLEALYHDQTQAKVLSK